jgi:predicted nucleic acid-binding Zn ribbon protein
MVKIDISEKILHIIKKRVGGFIMANIVYSTSERCLYCGEIIPEGRMICPSCEERLSKPQQKMTKQRKNDLLTIGANHK